MRWLAKAAAAIAVAACGWFAAAGASCAAPALWRVSDADSEIYLFGTVHALSPQAHWRTPLYDAVYARADTLWFEADMEAGDPAALAALLRDYGVDPARRLSDKLAPADLGVLARQVDLARIDHLRPWAAALMLSARPALAGGATVQAGADMVMTRAARAGAKRVKTFETLEDQARMFAALPEPAEVSYLTDVIRERQPHLALRQPVRIDQAWMEGDLAELGRDLKAQNPDLYEALLKRRNLAWADKLTAEMAGTGVELVNVGALHMAGPDGLPALMAARGFKVERIQ